MMRAWEHHQQQHQWCYHSSILLLLHCVMLQFSLNNVNSAAVYAHTNTIKEQSSFGGWKRTERNGGRKGEKLSRRPFKEICHFQKNRHRHYPIPSSSSSSSSPRSLQQNQKQTQFSGGGKINRNGSSSSSLLTLLLTQIQLRGGFTCTHWLNLNIIQSL